MKTIIYTYLVLIAMQSVTSAQCAINYKEILENKCSGVYLRHQDFSNETSKFLNLVLTKDNRYAIYLLNPSKSLPQVKVLNSNAYTIEEFQEIINSNENYSVYTFGVKETGEYGFEINFKNDEKACVLLAIYLRNDNNFKPGIYKNFDEFRYGNPSIEFNGQVSTNHYSGKGRIANYKLDSGRDLGKIFGFSDGGNVFINTSYPKLTSNPTFVKMEYLQKYYFYEYIKYIPVISGSMTTIMPILVQMILDVNTGQVRILNNQTLREILVNDQLLLDEFNRTSGKNKVLKVYLLKYMEKHYLIN